MSTSRARPTLIEQARRTQLVEVTIASVADRGYAATSLARIAEGAGITKAAVLYHFASKDAVVRAAYEHVLGALVGRVGAAVEAADAVDGPGAYVRSMIGHLRENPSHTRMIIEASIHSDEPSEPSARWGPLAELLGAARAAHGADESLDLRTLAIAVGGAIDAIVAESLADPDYDTAAAADVLAGWLDALLLRGTAV